VRLAATEAALSEASELNVQTAPIRVDTSLDTKYVIGQRSPYAVLEGSTEVTGSLERPFENPEFASAVGILSSGAIQAPEEWVLGVFPQGFASGNDALIVKGVKFGTWGVRIGPDDIVSETLDWTGTSCTWKFCDEIE
jgi:hypothetical protein